LNTDESKLFKSIKEGTSTETVVSRIKDLIFSKELDVDQKLPPERELAEQFNVSRSTVREALRSLKHEGFIEIRRGWVAGAYVVDQLYKPFYHSTTNLLRSGKIQMQQLLEARTAIECFGLRTVVGRIKEEDLQRLEAINENLRDTHDFSELLRKNSRFHLALAQLSGNVLITVMLQSLMKLMEDLGSRSSPQLVKPEEVIYASHAAVIEALRQKDLAECEELLASNIMIASELRFQSRPKKYAKSAHQSAPSSEKQPLPLRRLRKVQS